MIAKGLTQNGHVQGVTILRELLVLQNAETDFLLAMNNVTMGRGQLIQNVNLIVRGLFQDSRVL